MLMLASLPQHDQIAELYFVGDIDLVSIKPVIESAAEVSKDICLVLQQCLVKSVLKTVKEKEKEQESNVSET